jgi:hypothetical protein
VMIPMNCTMFLAAVGWIAAQSQSPREVIEELN